MRIGEIVEILIELKDTYQFGDYRKQALEEAANLLNKFSGMEEGTTYESVKN